MNNIKFFTKFILFIKILYLISNQINENVICLEDEYYNDSSNQCVRCNEVLIGCFSCELLNNNKFICKKCLNGYEPSYNNDVIELCNINCNYPYTYSSILRKDIEDTCQIDLWTNNHNSYNKYHNNLILNNPRETSNEELEALKLFYKETNGLFWINNNNWLIGDPCINNWFGVHCNLRGNIIGLIFNENYIQGIISSEVISRLIYLEKIIIINTLKYKSSSSENNIFYVSPNIWKLSRLNEIIIRNVDLFQSINSLFPENDKNILSNIEIIELDYNKIFGELPDFNRFKRLKSFSLSNNNLSGTLDNLNTLISDITIIQLNDNRLTGEVPTLNNIQNTLEVLDLRNNVDLEGDLPQNLFSNDNFNNLKYVGLILTHINPPINCKNHALCIKRLVKNAKSIHDDDFELSDYEYQFLLDRNNS